MRQVVRLECIARYSPRLARRALSARGRHRGRYDRALKSLPEASQLADQLLLFDNSEMLRPHLLIARFKQGKLVTLRNNVPAWAESVFATEFEEFRAARRQR